jgi:hypothetical protein
MQEDLITQEKMIKIIIYHGHMHKIILNEDVRKRDQNSIEVEQKEYFTEST